MTRIAIAGFQHETNTFASAPTTYEDFERAGSWPGLIRGRDVLDVFCGLNIPIGGFIDAASDWDLVPLLWANAEPGGYVEQAAFDEIAAMICEGVVEAGKIDGIYLDLHGAMVTQDFADGEGELLRRLRECIGADLPIAVSLDLHGNLTEDFIELASSTAFYRTYPHIDMARSGARAQALLAAEIARGAPFAHAFRTFDFMIPIPAQSTRREPAGRIYGLLDEIAKGEVVSIDLAMGFPTADIYHCGPTLVAYAETQTAADYAADKLHQVLLEAEGEFHNPLVPAVTAVEQAITIAKAEDRPVIIADPQDNPGAGAPGNSTGLLAALVSSGAQNAYLGMFWDPGTAAKAHEIGAGGEFEASFGRLYRDLGIEPFCARVRVERLSNGQFTCTGPMYGGAQSDLGLMADLRILDDDSAVNIVVGSVRAQTADQAIFTHLGINPLAQDIIVVKSAVHFLADYEPIAATVIFAEAPGVNPCRLDRIPYKNLRPGVRLGT